MEHIRPTPEGTRPEGDPRIDAAMQLLEAGIDRIHDSEEFKRFLEFQGKFHNYSINNQMLIWAQRPDATQVMGYGSKDGRTGWKSVGRQVRYGEKAIKIFAPLLKKELDLETGEIIERLRGYKIVNVFDVAQTDGEDLPEAPRPKGEIETSTEQGHRLLMANWDWLAEQGVTLFRSPVPGEPMAKGSYRPGREGRSPVIHVRSDMAIDMQAKTLAHESAHYQADHRFGTPREEAELVAESSAFVVAHRYGLDTSEYSFGYVTNWSQDRDLFRQKLGEIATVSRALITGIDRFYKEPVASSETPVKRDSSGVFLAEGLPQRLPSKDELRR